MAQKDQFSSDSITTTDRKGRRRFIRVGASFVLGTAATPLLANDCDRKMAEGEEKSPELAGHGSDSDAGENADRQGCGIRFKDKPKISRYKKLEGDQRLVKVIKYNV